MKLTPIIPIIQIVLICLTIPYLLVFIVLGVFRSNAKIEKDYSLNLRVSIFLPTYNEEGFIARKLDNLLTQTYPIHEILIYDCSDDATPVIVNEYKRKYPMIKMIREEKRIGMARTLNQAMHDATGDIIVKTDCDSVVKSNNALKELIANFANEDVGGATGICVAPHGVEKYFRKVMTIIQTAETNIDSTVIAHAASLMAFRKRVVENVDENSMADDTEEFVRIRKKGLRTVVDTSVVSEEDVPGEFRKRRLQKDRRAQGIIKVLLQNSHMIFNRSYGLFGGIVLPLEIFILVISPFFLIGLTSTILIGLYLLNPWLAAGALALIGVIFLRRSNVVWAIIDTQLSGLVGTLRSVSNQDRPLWAKVR